MSDQRVNEPLLVQEKFNVKIQHLFKMYPMTI